MLTKEEYLDALSYLASGQCSYCWKSGNEEVLVYEDANKMLTQLINEHFDNPPLKFEELEFFKPYWDNDENAWCYFAPVGKNKRVCVYLGVEECPVYYEFKIPKNRYFRKQVEVQSNE